MKKLLLIVVALSMLTACNNTKDSSKKSTKKIVQQSNGGNINKLSVVISNTLWEGVVGEVLRNVLAAPVDGLPVDEPLFEIKQIPLSAFKDYAKTNRLILKVEKGDANTLIEEDVTARPQKFITITGNSQEQIVHQIQDNAEKIVAAFKSTELKEKQRRIKKSLQDAKSLDENLGVTLKFPSAYRVSKHIANNNNKFFWIRKNIPTGSMNLMIYEVPMSAITKGDSTVLSIIKIRDSIGKQHIHYAGKDGVFQQTEPAYTPLFFNEIVDNKPTFVTKGMWELEDKGVSQGGPFINYAIEDKINNRYIIAEGFTYAPRVQKRDFMFELEAIIKTLRIK